MAEISTFPHSGLSYPDINFKIFSQGVKNISHLAQFKTTGVEVLQEKALRVSLYSQRLDVIVRESLSSLQVKLENTLALTYFTTLEEIDEALISQDIDEESKSEMRKERINIIKNLSNDITQLKQLFIEKTELLDKSSSDLHNVVIIEGTDKVLQAEQLRQKQLTEDIATKELERKEIEKKRDKIIEALDVIREHNLVDAFKDLIPTGENLSELDLAKPEIELLKQSLEISKKLLGQFSEGLKYIDLTDARKKLDNQIDTASTRLTELNRQLEQSEKLIAGVNAIIKIDQEKSAVVVEAEKLSRAWHIFIHEITALQGTSLNEVELSKPLIKQQIYLESLIKQLI
ncbi:TPA: pore-forming cytotoxin subunit YaxB [Yersinia enterocolitica]